MRRAPGSFAAFARPGIRALPALVVAMWVGVATMVAADAVVIRNGAGAIVMQRIEPRLRWSNLQVGETTQALLRKIEADPPAKGSAPVLFSGADRAAKARAAEVLAAEMHLALYRVDLSVVVSKYIGETEKNLDQIFSAAKQGGALLFFDEADALFGKRTNVTDSHDRYANQEVSYLLQRIEQFEGLAILATNQPVRIDPALLRRFRHVVDFVPKAG